MTLCESRGDNLKNDFSSSECSSWAGAVESCSRTLKSPAASHRPPQPGAVHKVVQDLIPTFPPLSHQPCKAGEGAALGRGAAALALSMLRSVLCSSGASPESRAAAESSRLGAFPSSFRCLLAWSLPVLSPSCTLPFQGYGLEKQERRGMHGICICLLFSSTGRFPRAGPAHTEPRWHSCRVWLGHSPAVPTWDASGYCANHLLFSVFPTC